MQSLILPRMPLQSRINPQRILNEEFKSREPNRHSRKVRFEQVLMTSVYNRGFSPMEAEPQMGSLSAFQYFTCCIVINKFEIENGKNEI